MSAVQTSFLFGYQQRTGALAVSILTQRHDSVRSDIVVDLPVLQDWHRGRSHAVVCRYEKVWVDPHYAIVEIHDIDFSSGKSSCLDQRYESIQEYLGGTESWLGLHKSEFAEGRAVCLWQSFEVVQDYLGGSETWASSHNADYALGRAVCLWQCFEVIQDYLGGSETWSGSHNADFALGKAVCLWQSFEVIQDYLGGSETWISSHHVDFALGKAVCLWQSLEVIQSYLGGTEAWTSSHHVDFALGRAVCLCHEFQVIQDYIGGYETWISSHNVDFALGRSVCLYQTYHIDQPYMGGLEAWPSWHESFFSTGRSSGLFQCFDVIQPYAGGNEDWPIRYDTNTLSVFGHSFLVEVENRDNVVSLHDNYDIIRNSQTEASFAYECIKEDRFVSTVFSLDFSQYHHVLATVATTEVNLGKFGERLRVVETCSHFGIVEYSSFELLDTYDYTENVRVAIPYIYEWSHAGRFLVWLQEESYYEYTACLINIHSGLVTTVVTDDLNESITSLKDKCVGDSQWELEYETTVRFYNPDRPDQSRDPVLWRFMTKDGVHWKEGPVVSDLRAVTLPSFTQLHFTADWPYRSHELQIDSYQLEPTREGDWFDLGVWVSESAGIDTDQSPALTIPYASDTTNYDVHVPRRENARFIGVAPIRRFPYEEVGALSVVYIS